MADSKERGRMSKSARIEALERWLSEGAREHAELVGGLRWLVRSEIDSARRCWLDAERYPRLAADERRDALHHLFTAHRIAVTAGLLGAFPELVFFWEWQAESLRLHMLRLDTENAVRCLGAFVHWVGRPSPSPTVAKTEAQAEQLRAAS